MTKQFKLVSEADIEKLLSHFCQVEHQCVHLAVVSMFNSLPAAPDVAGEPVAWIYSFIHSSALGYGDEIIGPVTTLDREKAYKVGHINIRQLYTSPQPDRTAELQEQVLQLQDKVKRYGEAVIELAEGLKLSGYDTLPTLGILLAEINETSGFIGGEV